MQKTTNIKRLKVRVVLKISRRIYNLCNIEKRTKEIDNLCNIEQRTKKFYSILYYVVPCGFCIVVTSSQSRRRVASFGREPIHGFWLGELRTTSGNKTKTILLEPTVAPYSFYVPFYVENYYFFYLFFFIISPTNISLIIDAMTSRNLRNILVLSKERP